MSFVAAAIVVVDDDDDDDDDDNDGLADEVAETMEGEEVDGEVVEETEEVTFAPAIVSSTFVDVVVVDDAAAAVAGKCAELWGIREQC